MHVVRQGRMRSYRKGLGTVSWTQPPFGTLRYTARKQAREVPIQSCHCRCYDSIIRFFGLGSRIRHTRYTGHWSAGGDGAADSFSLGPQPEPRPVQGSGQTHLAVTSNCDRHGAPNELILPAGSARHGRTSRPRVSETDCSRTEYSSPCCLHNFACRRLGQPKPTNCSVDGTNS